ncbi:MurR/RpiR family transcriptional regulator [Collinsella sp. AGMB00827]|uniref:MurR/RpiR family transcriptional regulator n=1 Tax=Collinsella ureilytica TaxID=2869515 RepID=A0ABS7MMM4_9ACTN|nr:MurR/RpiR family transcriptional regulator [Collinsella urealyticum]MBY4797675.1 MurR/RpiR family transcriptional regulator [Collinsella urealyticum]
MAVPQSPPEEAMRSVVDTLASGFDHFSRAEQKVARKVLENPSAIAELNVSQLAELCQVSDATVVRMSQHAGYSGYYQMRIMLMSDLRQQAEDIDGGTPRDPVTYSFTQSLLYLKLLCNPKNVACIDQAAELILEAPTVYVAAIGNSAPLADDLEFRLNTLGVRAFTGSRIETKIRHLSNAEPGDVLIAISRSGASTGLLRLVELAHEKQVEIIAITGDKVSPLTRQSKVVISSANPARVFQPIAPRVESHLGEFFLIDALVLRIDLMMRSRGDELSADELDLLLSEFKL